MLEESFKKFADRKAFLCMDKSISYRDLDECRRRSAPICRARACKGRRRRADDAERAAISGPTAAVLRAGYAVVNVNPLYTPRELEHH